MRLVWFVRGTQAAQQRIMLWDSTMRSVNITHDDRKPRGCKLMNLQYEARDSKREGVALSSLPVLPFFMRIRAVMQGEELMGKTG